MKAIKEAKAKLALDPSRDIQSYFSRVVERSSTMDTEPPSTPLPDIVPMAVNEGEAPSEPMLDIFISPDVSMDFECQGNQNQSESLSSLQSTELDGSNQNMSSSTLALSTPDLFSKGAITTDGDQQTSSIPPSTDLVFE
jgi:hypothetical protein